MDALQRLLSSEATITWADKSSLSGGVRVHEMFGFSMNANKIDPWEVLSANAKLVNTYF